MSCLTRRVHSPWSDAEHLKHQEDLQEQLRILANEHAGALNDPSQAESPEATVRRAAQLVGQLSAAAYREDGEDLEGKGRGRRGLSAALRVPLPEGRGAARVRPAAAAPRPRREEPGHQDEGPRAAHRRDPGLGPASQWVVSWRSMASDKFAEPVRRILPASQWVASWPASQWVVSLGACVSSDPLATPALAWSGDPAGARRLEPE